MGRQTRLTSYRVAGANLTNDYAAWLAAVEAHGLRLSVGYSERPSTRYRGEMTKAILGLQIEGGDVGGSLQLTTRCDTWRIEPKAKPGPAAAEGIGAEPAPDSPWTRFNNSAPLDFKGLFPGALPEGVEEFGEVEEVSRTGHRYPVQDEAIGDQPARSVAAG